MFNLNFKTISHFKVGGVCVIGFLLGVPICLQVDINFCVKLLFLKEDIFRTCTLHWNKF